MKDTQYTVQESETVLTLRLDQGETGAVMPPHFILVMRIRIWEEMSILSAIFGALKLPPQIPVYDYPY